MWFRIFLAPTFQVDEVAHFFLVAAWGSHLKAPEIQAETMNHSELELRLKLYPPKKGTKDSLPTINS